MIGSYLVADLSDAGAVQAMSDALRAWEPRLELYLPPRHARLFEPDGTLYAVALSGPMTVVAGRRRQEIARGDAIVVPQGLALDIEPEVDLLGVRYDGPPPDHFRERFIQVWGFEHLAAQASTCYAPTVASATSSPSDDVRHRISYAFFDPAYVPSTARRGWTWGSSSASMESRTSSSPGRDACGSGHRVRWPSAPA